MGFWSFYGKNTLKTTIFGSFLHKPIWTLLSPQTEPYPEHGFYGFWVFLGVFGINPSKTHPWSQTEPYPGHGSYRFGSFFGPKTCRNHQKRCQNGQKQPFWGPKMTSFGYRDIQAIHHKVYTGPMGFIWFWHVFKTLKLSFWGVFGWFYQLRCPSWDPEVLKTC